MHNCGNVYLSDIHIINNLPASGSFLGQLGDQSKDIMLNVLGLLLKMIRQVPVKQPGQRIMLSQHGSVAT